MNFSRLVANIPANGNRKTISPAASSAASPSTWLAKAVRAALGLSLLALPPASLYAQSPFLPPPPATVSTVPSNGDVNPYGVAFVPPRFAFGGTIQPGDILVSNFNNSANLQGTGTTIVSVTPSGKTGLFYQGKTGLGLTAALGVVRTGFVFAGNMPTSDGTSATAKPGSILVLNDRGILLGYLGGQSTVNGPWGMAINDHGQQVQIFVSNVLNGTVVRFDLFITEQTGTISIIDSVVIASGLPHRPDPAALELGPSGLAYDERNDILYVADSADDTVRAINFAGSLTSAGSNSVIYQDNTHLHGPLDLVLAPNGHLLVANSDGNNVDPNQPSEIVEFNTGGEFVTQFSVDPNNGGAFGVNIQNVGGAYRFAAVDDNQNALILSTIIPTSISAR
jgi:hypothetical protein